MRVEQLAVKVFRLLERGDSAFGDPQVEGQQTIRAEAGVGVEHPDQRVKRHAATGQQRQGQRELDDDQRASQTVTPSEGGVATFLQGLDQVHARRLPGWRAACGNACHGARAQREEQDRKAERDLGFRWQRVRRKQRDDDLDEHDGEHDADSTAGCTEQQAFDQQLAHDGPRRRADGGPHGQFPLSHGATGQQQVGDVGAGNQQQEGHGAQQQPQPLLRAVADEVIAEWLDTRAPVGAVVAAAAFDRARHRVEVRVGLGDRDATFQPAHHVEKRDVVAGLAGCDRQRQPQFGLLAVRRASAEHADDGIGNAAGHTNRPSNDVGIPAETVLPEPVRQDGHAIAARRAFLFTKRAAERQRVAVAQHREETGRGNAGLDALGAGGRRDARHRQGPTH